MRPFYLIKPKNHEMSKAMEVVTKKLLSHDLLT